MTNKNNILDTFFKNEFSVWLIPSYQSGTLKKIYSFVTLAKSYQKAI
jgi:hypothetical protein